MADTHIGVRLRPIIRLFVSSTFSDLKLERDALQQHVFPKLEQHCLKQGFQFQAIDLRWGVSTEAGLDHRTMRICIEELRRSQEVSPEPNFLILIGNRYGWRPLPEEISADEFHSLEQAAEQMKVANQQSQPVELLRQWYWLDENSLTPVYVLQPRSKPKSGDPNDRDYTTADAWRNIEQALWPIINHAFPASQSKDRFATPVSVAHPLPCIVRFQASATEQEIWCGAFCAPDASQHVLAFFRELDPPQNVEDSEQIRDYFDIASGQIDPLSQAAQRELKQAIKDRLGKHAIDLKPTAKLEFGKDQSGTQAATISTDHIDELCREVETRLMTLIERQIKEYWHDRQSSENVGSEQSSEQRAARELEIERDEHLRFGRERGPKAAFVGRPDQLQRILDYVKNESSLPTVIHGASGCGKTALMARAIDDVPVERQPIIRFIGITPGSSDLRSLLRSLCHEFRQRNPIEESIPSDIRELVDEFRKHLQAATAERPIILFLDALDQLAESDNGRQLFWIPFGQLPSHVKLVVSCLSDRDEKDPASQPFIALERRKLPAESMVNLDALSLDDAKTLLFDVWLQAAGRTVTESQRHLIEQRLDSEPCRQPLYLKLLFEEARLWRSDNTPTEVGDGVPGLLEQMIERLSQPQQHGESLVRFVLGYIASARHGLSETEILEVLFADPDYTRQLDEASRRNNHTLPSEPPRIPIALWSRLRSDLAPYLTERAAPGGDVLTFYHRQIAEWVKARFDDDADWNPRGRLATFFANQDYFLESLEEQRALARRLPPTPRPSNIRKVDELPHHVLEVAKRADPNSDNPEAKEWDAVADLLTNLQFLEAKAEFMIFELVQDFSAALSAMPSDHPRLRILSVLQEAIRRDVHFINRHPTSLFQCLWNTCWWYDCPQSPEHYGKRAPSASSTSQANQRPTDHRTARLWELLESWRSIREAAIPGIRWLRSIRPPAIPLGGAQRAILQGHANYVLSVSFSPNGQQIASGSEDNTARICDAESGQELCELRGHKSKVTSVSYSADCQRVATGSWDATVRIWDAFCGLELRVIRGHENNVTSVVFSTDGRRIASGSLDQTVRVWDVEHGEQLLILKGHQKWVTSVAFSPDGAQIVSGAHDQTVRVWDAESGKLVRLLRGHSAAVTSVSFSPDGRRIVSGSNDRTARVWDSHSGEELFVLTGMSYVCDVSFSPDGRRIACACDDGTVRVWNAERGVQITNLRGHENEVRSASFSPDGRRIVSGSYDGTVRVWNAAGGGVKRLRECEDKVDCVSFSPDGRLVITASERKTLRLWNAQTGVEIKAFEWHKHPVFSASFSPDSRRIVTGSSDGTVRVGDVKSLAKPHVLSGHEAAVTNASFSPDGRRIVSGSWDNSVRVWDADNGEELRIFHLHDDLVMCVAFSADGRWIVSGSKGGLVTLFDTDSGVEAIHFGGHTDRVMSVAFAPDSRRIVSGSRDQTMRVWDTESGACVEVITGNADAAAIARLLGSTEGSHWAISRNGETVIESVADRQVLAWFPDPLLALHPDPHASLTTSPGDAAWGGVAGATLCLLKLESGDTDGVKEQ